MIGSRLFFRNCGYFCVLVLFIVSSAVGIEGQSDANTEAELPELRWAHGALATSNGHFELSWTPGPADGAYEFVRLEEHDLLRDANGEWQPHFINSASANFLVYEPGIRTYQIRACRVLDGADVCGPVSASLSVEITDQARQSRPVTLASEVGPGANPESSLTEGASAIRPGQYESSVADFTAWNIFWTNELRRVAADPLYGDVNDVHVLWATYRDFAGSNPPAGQENLQPVWLMGSLRRSPSNPDLYIGSLYYYRQVNGETVAHITGSVRLNSQPGLQNPVVSWYVPDGSFYRGSVRWIHDPLAWDPDVFGVPDTPNPIDHFSGWWSPQEAGSVFGLFNAIVGNWESSLLAFFDGQGEPVWATAFWDGYFTNDPPTENLSEFCHFAVGNAWYADEGLPAGRSVEVHEMCNAGWSARRGYGPVVSRPDDSGELTLNVTVPTSLRPAGGQLQYGTVAAPAEIRKLVSHHDVRHFVNGLENAPYCFLINGQCSLELTWFSDGYYPGAMVYRRLSSSQGWVSPVLVGGWLQTDRFAVENFTHSISQEGTYRFELRRGSQNGQLLGLSDEIQVIEPTAATPEVAPTPIADPNFLPTDASSRVGASRGEFSVGGSGSASYRVPIMTVAGAGGVAPQISLNYDSHQGRSFLGLGWGLSGFSTISRCGQTLLHDQRTTGVQLDSTDRFCFDGQRLMRVGGAAYGAVGSVYRLESDDFTRVTAHGNVTYGITHFTVQRKDGSTSTFGSGARQKFSVLTGSPGDQGVC